ncbi:metal-dependent hydrolase [Phenylobacterium deserti]|uniref:Metal-dependent hydrolase n=1 Tax=Phenylobacterium deserti TaxID=1914756 RepID=A0A328ANK3_9CAUL|nr:metal-dependent hydrolase [Phenylobacterium deserti]RAK56520.1 metal-dependent hydrolase [Phenylobacterium deserti]
MLTVRDRRFDIDAAAVGEWRSCEPVAAAFYDSLSALFPQGERFFMDSVRRYRDAVGGELAGQVRQFIAQEALHTREHLAFNAQVEASGHDIAPLETRTRRELDRVRVRSDVAQLATTVALEHFTAVLAHHLIAHPEHLAAAPLETRRLWLWHAAEEIEHKAVAFDVLAAVTSGWSPLRRWAFRSWRYLDTLWRLLRVMVPNFVELRRQHDPGARPLAELALFLLGRPGLLRRMAPELAKFFAPGFHPWALEDAALAEAALAA